MVDASAKAQAEGKNVFLIFSTAGCGWCKVLKNFVESDDIKPIFSKYFVSVQLMLGEDAHTTPGATSYEKKYGPAQGVPYHAFIRPDGNEIVDSKENGDGGNIGYPFAPNEVAWFMKMIKKAAPEITDADFRTIEAKLKAFKRS